MRNLAAVLALVSLCPAPVFADALDDARATFLAAWNQTPLVVRTSIFVTEPAPGFGIYEERPTNVFPSTGPLYIYLNTEGYGWNDAGGSYEFGLEVGIRLLTAGGDIIYEEANFLDLKIGSREMVTEMFVNITLDMTDFALGDYVIDLVLSDIASDETANVTMNFAVE